MSKKVKKYIVFWDALIISILTFIAFAFFWAIIDSIDLFNPFDEFIDNFDFTDLYYSEFLNDEMPTDTNVFIVNIGNLDRRGIADLVFDIQKYKPAVIGIDAVFAERRGMDDYYLQQALNSGDNIVLGGFGIYENDKAKGIERTNEFFGQHPVGHLEMQANPKTVREFDKFIKFGDTIINSFSMEIVSRYDNELFLEFARRRDQTELINYRGGKMPFIIFDYEEISDSNSNLSIIEDKIVLMGYVRMFSGAPSDTLDSHFSPLQKSDYGYADAKGIEIHAHIISMILMRDYIDQFPFWTNYLLAFVVLLLFTMWLVYYYVNGTKFFDILSKPIQFILIVVVLWGTFMIFSSWGIKINMVPTVLALVLCIEVLYLYEETLELFKIDSYLTQNFNYTKDERKKVLRSIIRFDFLRPKPKRSNK
ncbi:MAG: CHASE2 domain-containing protein [Bacteroidales bacterium]|nr:CHASE2 domain-containing protein [Bacteroidales bacterium]MDD4216631.1 CHASE2 domain-containing protein [Bacteroidales bacterium]